MKYSLPDSLPCDDAELSSRVELWRSSFRSRTFRFQPFRVAGAKQPQTMALSPESPLKFRAARFPQHGFKLTILPMPSQPIGLHGADPLPSVASLSVPQCALAVSSTGSQPRAPLLGGNYSSIIAHTGSSASPIFTPELRFSSLYQEPLIYRTFPTLMADLS